MVSSPPPQEYHSSSNPYAPVASLSHEPFPFSPGPLAWLPRALALQFCVGVRIQRRTRISALAFLKEAIGWTLGWVVPVRRPPTPPLLACCNIGVLPAALVQAMPGDPTVVALVLTGPFPFGPPPVYPPSATTSPRHRVTIFRLGDVRLRMPSSSFLYSQ